MPLSSPRSNSTPDERDDSASAVTICETRPGKAVFMEENNCDGWIATDTTVELAE